MFISFMLSWNYCGDTSGSQLQGKEMLGFRVEGWGRVEQLCKKAPCNWGGRVLPINE